MSMRDFVTLACGTELRNEIGKGGSSRSILSSASTRGPSGSSSIG